MEIPSRIHLAQRDQIATKRAGDLARRQFGPIARRQLLRVGFTPARIGRWVAAERLFPKYDGVYAWGRPDLPEKGELAAGLLFAGHGAMLTGLVELWWLGLLHRRPDLLDIDAPGRVGSCADLRIHHPRVIAPQWHEGLPVGPLPRAILLASEALGFDSTRLVLARAEFERILSLTDLERELGSGRPGSRLVRRAMDAHLPQLARCANVFERDFVLLCERHGLPIPEPNVPKGRFVPDMTWEDRKLIVELDGKDAHRTPAQKQRDKRRQEWLEARGYTVIRFTWAEVQFAERSVVAMLVAHLS